MRKLQTIRWYIEWEKKQIQWWKKDLVFLTTVSLG